MSQCDAVIDLIITRSQLPIFHGLVILPRFIRYLIVECHLCCS